MQEGGQIVSISHPNLQQDRSGHQRTSPMNKGSRVFTPGNRTLGRMLQDALDDICKLRAGEQDR